MSDSPARPPYRAALLVLAGVLSVYAVTLAPTVTFWDAGEMIAAAKILGVPHPPGTPLFVLLGNVWARIIPFGEFAWRTNLMSAVFSAAGAALWFLLVHQALAREAPLVRLGGAAAGAALSAFAFTVWQNSNETEVYMVATFTIAAVSWLAILWREVRGTSRAAHYLLIIVYLMAVSIGNHLLAVLVGPALIAFLFHVLRAEPNANQAERGTEWAQLAVVAAAWGLMVHIGLGATGLNRVLGFDLGDPATWRYLLPWVPEAAFVAAAIFATTRRAGGFAAMALVVAAIGVSTYAVLYIRAGHAPMINEADPSTFDALLSVMRREQYPPRTPLDNPIYPSGLGNPGRSFDLIALQLANYLQYFDWQWARSLGSMQPVFAPARLPFTLLFVALGVYGLVMLREADRSVFWLLFVLWLTTGLGLVGYMNFKPGFALAWERYPDMDMHEVRERDYFFVVSFLCWGLFAGMGLASVARRLVRPAGGAGLGLRWPGAVYAAALLPLVLNFRAASRRHGPDATLARDFAYDLLQSVEPHGIVFTYGDNDTFPLWYAQEVEEVRQDVAVVNLSLASTPWHIRQLRDNPVRPFDPERASERYRAMAPPEPPPPLLRDLSDESIDRLQGQAVREFEFRAGPIRRVYPTGTPLYVKDQVVLLLVRQNWDLRPITWSVTAGQDNWVGLEEYFLQQGLVFKLVPDSGGARGLGPPGMMRVPVDVERTAWLADTVYRYAGLFEAETLELEPTARGIVRNLSFPWVSLVSAYEASRDRDALVYAVRRWAHLVPDTTVQAYLEFLESPAADSIFAP